MAGNISLKESLSQRFQQRLDPAGTQQRARTAERAAIRGERTAANREQNIPLLSALGGDALAFPDMAQAAEGLLGLPPAQAAAGLDALLAQGAGQTPTARSQVSQGQQRQGVTDTRARVDLAQAQQDLGESRFDFARTQENIAMEVENNAIDMQRRANELLESSMDLANQGAISGFQSPTSYAKAVMDITSTADALTASSDIMDSFIEVGGTFQFPSEAKGAAGFRMLEMRRALQTYSALGTLTPGELEYIDGLITDPTRLTSAAKWTETQIGEFKAFQQLMERKMRRDQQRFPTLNRDRPELWEVSPSRNQMPPPEGFTEIQ